MKQDLVPTPQKKVLLVDDQEINLRLLSRAYQLRGIESHTATDGITAEQELTNNDIAVVISDWHFPNGGGAHVAHLAEEKQIPIFIVTGKPLDAVAEIRCTRYEALFPRPFNMDSLVDATLTYLLVPAPTVSAPAHPPQ